MSHLGRFRQHPVEVVHEIGNLAAEDFKILLLRRVAVAFGHPVDRIHRGPHRISLSPRSAELIDDLAHDFEGQVSHLAQGPDQVESFEMSLVVGRLVSLAASPRWDQAFSHVEFDRRRGDA